METKHTNSNKRAVAVKLKTAYCESQYLKRTGHTLPIFQTSLGEPYFTQTRNAVATGYSKKNVIHCF